MALNYHQRGNCCCDMVCWGVCSCIYKKKFQHVDRNNMFLIQTPQCFFSKSIKKAYQQKYKLSFTDDASVFINNNGKVNILHGEETNIKITTKEDLKLFANLI